MYKFIGILVFFMYSSLCLAQDSLICDSEDDVPAADNEANFYRPCDFSDHNCIADYMAAHSDATPNVNTIDDPHYRSANYIYLPSFNMSFVLSDIYLSGLNAEFVEFYHNNVTDKLVIGVNYTNVINNATVATISYHRLAKEPAVTKSSAYEIYPTFTITTVFDDVSEGLEFSKTYTHAYIPFLPNITITETAYYYPADAATVEAMWAEFIENTPIVVQEAFQTASVYCFWAFLQNAVIDFGVSEYY